METFYFLKKKNNKRSLCSLLYLIYSLELRSLVHKNSVKTKKQRKNY